MTDLYLDPVTGDLDITNGLQLTDSQDIEARQRIEQYLAINLGEWFANINDGLPYIRNPDEDFATNLRYFLGNKFPDTPRFIASTMTSALENLPFISSVTSEYTFDQLSREFTYSPVCVLIDGAEITFPTIFSTNL